MSGKAYEQATIAGLEGIEGWSPIRRHFGAQSFGINAWTAHEEGERLIGAHDEEGSGHEELYLVTAGRATFTVDGDELDAPAGTLVFVADPAIARGAVARQPETTVLAIGGKPGEVYRPLAWETNAEVFPLFDRGEHAEAKRILSEGLDLYGETSALYYNLACAEAQLGESDEAFGHLRTAIEQRPSFAQNAREDPDLEPLRDDPRFAELTATA